MATWNQVIHTKEELEDAIAFAQNNYEAAEFLGIDPGSLTRLCRKFGVETPYKRRLRLKRNPVRNTTRRSSLHSDGEAKRYTAEEYEEILRKERENG